MSDVSQTTASFPLIHFAGSISVLGAIISAIGVVFLVAMFVFFKTPRQDLALTFGLINDICVALQYLLAIPIALALYQILVAYNPALIRAATILGIAAMLVVCGLQLMLIFKAITFERQVVWVSLAMLLGVGSWLVITGIVARSTGKLPNSLLMSILAVPYIGYPVWAFWLAKRLLAW